jgi:hypothetical protein
MIIIYNLNIHRIAYHVEKPAEHVKTRKAWSEAQVYTFHILNFFGKYFFIQIRHRVKLEKERRLEALHRKLLDGREQHLAQIDAELKGLDEGLLLFFNFTVYELFPIY